MQLYCAAAEVDDTDVVLWNKLGTLVGGGAAGSAWCRASARAVDAHSPARAPAAVPPHPRPRQAAQCGYWAGARHAFERGLQGDPQHPTMRDKMLQLLLHVGDAGAAHAFAAAVARQDPRHAAAQRVLRRQQSSQPLELSLAAGLLALPPPAAPGECGEARGVRPLLPHAQTRSVSLEHASWQCLLHQALTFLGSNRMAGGGTPATAARAGGIEPPLRPSLLRLRMPAAPRAAPAAAGGAPVGASSATAAPTPEQHPSEQAGEAGQDKQHAAEAPAESAAPAAAQALAALEPAATGLQAAATLPLEGAERAEPPAATEVAPPGAVSADGAAEGGPTQLSHGDDEQEAEAAEEAAQPAAVQERRSTRARCGSGARPSFARGRQAHMQPPRLVS